MKGMVLKSKKMVIRSSLYVKKNYIFRILSQIVHSINKKGTWVIT